MKRFDLRHLKNDFYTKMGEILESSLQNGEVGIFLFELGDFGNVAKSAEFMQGRGCEILNSVRFNHCDWTLVVRKDGAKSNQNPTSKSSADSSADSSEDFATQTPKTQNPNTAQDAQNLAERENI